MPMKQPSSPEPDNPLFVLGLVGSPRPGGNTDMLVEQALSGARELGAKTEKIIINTLRMSACQDCDTVRDDGRCGIEDDFQCVYTKVLRANAIVLASPLYFGSVSAQTKTLIDRFQCHWRAFGRSPAQRRKRGGFICVAASSRRDFFDNAAVVVKNFFATAGVQYYADLFCPELEEKGAAIARSDYMRKAAVLGRELVESKG